MSTNVAVLSGTRHIIATHRSLARLVQYGQEFAAGEVAQGRRVIWAPCHALGRSLSLRSWIIEQANELLGASSSVDAPTLLSGAADCVVIADPGVADRESLRWLSDMLACAEEVKGVTAAPPLPRLVVLLPVRTSGADAVHDFTNQLIALGSEDAKLAGREADLSAIEIDGMLRAMSLRNHVFQAAVSLAPLPLTREEYHELMEEASASQAEFDALFNSPLYAEVTGYLVPTSTEVRERLRANLAPEALTRGARLLLDVCRGRLEALPDAVIELHARAGDQKQAARLAKRRVNDHEMAGRFSEALRVLRLGRELGFAIDSATPEIDEARTAGFMAEIGDFVAAREIVKPLIRRRNLYRNSEFVESLALAMRTLAMKDNFEPRMADSLLRRAIRLNRGDLDSKVRLTVLRVSLLRSGAFGLDERADWLLTHVNQETLSKVSAATQALYLLETGRQLIQDGMYKRAYKRLRRMISLAGSDQQLASALLLMARCRMHFSDTEGATRFAAGSIQYGLRSATLSLVREAAAVLRTAGQQAQAEGRPRRRDKVKPRLAQVDVPTRVVAPPEQMFDILQRRFGVLRWARRRADKVDAYGTANPPVAESTAVYEEVEGQVKRVSKDAGGSGVRAVVLLRHGGDDLVHLSADAPSDVTDESIVRFLLGDRDTTPLMDTGTPSRKNVVDEYMRRATGQPAKRGLHKAIETLFNKDLLLYLEDQGFTKEDMAAHLGVSRATLYRMYARAGLN